MALKYTGSLRANSAPVLRTRIIANSAVMTVGDAVGIDTSGFAALAGAAGTMTVYGIVHSIVTVNDVAPSSDGSGANFVDTYTAASDNQTVAKVAVKIDISRDSLYSAPADATLGTTTGSDIEGYSLDLMAASDTLDESSAVTGAAQFFSHGVDPQDSTRLIVSIQESQIWGV